MRLLILSLMTSLCLPGLALAQTEKEKPTEAKQASTPNRETEKLIEGGLQAYRKGHHQAAVEMLQKAINKIQKEGTRSLADFLPKVDGWKADEPDSSSGSWGAGDQQFQWSQVDCTYRDGDAKVEVTITNSPMLVQSQQMILSNPPRPGCRSA